MCALPNLLFFFFWGGGTNEKENIIQVNENFKNVLNCTLTTLQIHLTLKAYENFNL